MTPERKAALRRDGYAIGECVDEIDRLEAQLAALEAMRTHCTRCGADYVATGIEAGCPCLLQAKLDAIRALPEQWRKDAELIVSQQAAAWIKVCAASLDAILNGEATP